MDLDRTAITLSLVCLAHCICLPVGLAVLPALGATLLDTETTVHWILLTAALPVSVIAVLIASRRHRDLLVITLASSGLLALFSGASHLFGHELEAALSMVGAGLILVAHLRNWRLSRLYGCAQSGGNPSAAA